MLNSQCSILNPLRIEHWELSIGQILSSFFKTCTSERRKYKPAGKTGWREKFRRSLGLMSTLSAGTGDARGIQDAISRRSSKQQVRKTQSTAARTGLKRR